jgi:hypothetical protein
LANGPRASVSFIIRRIDYFNIPQMFLKSSLHLKPFVQKEQNINKRSNYAH